MRFLPGFARLSLVATLSVTLCGAALAARHHRAPAPPPEAGPVLWGKLAAGMTPGEVRQAAPQRLFSLTQACVGRATLRYQHGRLIGVTLTGRDTVRAGPFCSARVRATLVADYGQSDPSLRRALEDSGWIYEGPSPLPRLVRSIDPGRTVFDAWSTNGKSVLFTAPRRGGAWKVLFVPNATPVQPDQL